VTFTVNVKGKVLASEAVAEHMMKRGAGKIVNIASHAGRGEEQEAALTVRRRAAVIHLTQSFALELAPHSINVKVVCPGTIWTPMWERIAERDRRNDPKKTNLTGRQIFDQAILGGVLLSASKLLKTSEKPLRSSRRTMPLISRDSPSLRCRWSASASCCPSAAHRCTTARLRLQSASWS